MPLGELVHAPIVRTARLRSVRVPLLTVAIVAGLAIVSPAQSAQKLPGAFPAAGVIRTAKLVVRAKPRPRAKVVRTLGRYRKDRQFQIVLALSSRRGADGRRWLQLSLPGRPNGTRGWVRADLVDVIPVVNRVVVNLSSRRIEVRRVRDSKLLLRGVVAVGAPGAETPRGRNFYVQSAFVPTDPFYGTYALETSAGSRADRLARRRHRRDPRHEQPRATRSGGLAWVHPGRERRRARLEAAGAARHADRHRP